MKTEKMKTIPIEVFNQLYKDQYRKLYAYVFRLLKDESLAQDIIQECFSRLNKQDYEKFKDRLNSWLFTVCRNLSYKEIAKRKRYVELFEEDRDELDENRDPREEFDMKHYKKVLKKCIKKLSPRQKEVIKLRFFKDYDYNKCADILKTSSGNIGFNQTTAIQNLRKMMQKYM